MRLRAQRISVPERQALNLPLSTNSQDIYKATLGGLLFPREIHKLEESRRFQVRWQKWYGGAI